jgi:signal transduction histidine kinase
MGAGSAAAGPFPNRHRVSAALLSGLVLLGGLALTWGAVQRERAKAQAQLQGDFHLRIRDTAIRIEQSIRTYEQVLRDLQSFLRVARPGRREFRAFVQGMALERNFPGIQGVGYAVLVPANRRAAHEAAVRAEGFPGYAIHPPGDRDPYTAILYLEPFAGRNLRAFGYDMFSEQVRRAAMVQAAELDDIVMSGRVQLVQETGQDLQAGFLLYLPLKAPDGTTRAWVYAPFRIRDLLTGVMGEQKPDADLDLEVYDGSEARLPSLMHDSHPGVDRPGTLPGFRSELHLVLAHHPWTLVYTSLPGFEARIERGKAGTVALAGLAGSLLLALLTWSLAASRNRAVGLAEIQEALNRDLARKVQDAVGELRRKDQLLIAQGRHAAMGEMIGNIAHQWRQPLSSLGMLLANLRDAVLAGDLRPAAMEEAFARGFLLIDRMSSTINDFRNYFRPDREPAAFSALEQVHRAVALVDVSSKAAGVAIQVTAPHDLRLQGYPNEYCQVLLNLLGNAQESIRAARAEGGTVRVRLEAEGGEGVLTVSDDGAGIPEAALERIFEPYFSTREGGTGIGLYMSKQIIETHMGGRISARNLAAGAELRVTAPLAKEQP